MRGLLQAALMIGIFLGTAPTGSGQTEPKDIIAKAIKAHGGEGKLAKFEGIQLKAKGTLEPLGGMAFTQESSIQLPNKFKEVLHLDIMGQQVNVTAVFDGTKASLTANGKAVAVNDKLQEELKEAAHVISLTRLVALKDKTNKLTPLGEIKVNKRPAVGIRVSSKGHKDVSLYFDKDNGLLVKIERRGVDPMSGQEFTEERIITEYQDMNGQKTAKKVLINRDGRKFMEAEVTEVKYLEKIDDSEFAQP